MSTINIFKEKVLPSSLIANSIYLIAKDSDQEYVEMFITGKTSNIIRRIINTTDVQSMIDDAIDNITTDGIRIINGKTGESVTLTYSDVGADANGSALAVKNELDPKIAAVDDLAKVNQLQLTTKADQHIVDVARSDIETNRVDILSKADITALATLTALVNTKADQNYVNEQIALIVEEDQEILAAIQEISTALAENSDLLDALEYTVANRVRFDVANQALTSLQKHNARTNIGAEEIGVAQMLVNAITAQSIGAATTLQGQKADSALQSGDVAPVALTGLFSSLAGQNKIFDVINTAYTIGSNVVINSNDTLNQMLGKLQEQINNIDIKVRETLLTGLVTTTSGLITSNDSILTALGKLQNQITNFVVPPTVWVPIASVATVQSYVTVNNIELARINGMLWIRGSFQLNANVGAADFITITDNNYKTIVPNPADFNFNRLANIIIFNNETPTTINYRISANRLTHTLQGYSGFGTTATQLIIQPTCIGKLLVQ